MAHEPQALGTYLDRTTTALLVEALRYYSSHPKPHPHERVLVMRIAEQLDDGTLFLLETSEPRPVPPKWEAGCGTPGRSDGRQLVHASWDDAAEQLLDWMAELDTLEGHDVSIQARRRREVHGIGAGNEGWIRALGRAFWLRKVEGDVSGS